MKAYASTIFTIIDLPLHDPEVSPSRELAHDTLKHCRISEPLK